MIMRLMSIVAVIGFFSANANAGGCRVVAVKETIIRNDAIVTAIPLTTVVAVPVYSYVNYTPNYSQNQQFSADQVAELVMKKIESRWGNGGGPPAVNKSVQPVAVPNNANVIAIITNKCAGCHTGQALSGGGVSFFDQHKTIKGLSREMKWDIFDQVYDGKMPKGSEALSDTEADLIRQWARQK